MRKVVVFLLFGFFAFAKSINIAAAANMSFALPKLIESFTKSNPHIEVKTTIASSGKLALQIMRGASYDLFLSADMKYPKKLYKKGFAVTRPLIYAKGKLVFFSKRANLKDIAHLSTIAIANPKTAPYGKAAMEVLQKLNIPNIEKKLLFGESVAQTTTYALHGAQGAFIAASALYSKTLKPLQKFAHPLDPKLYTPIKQGVVLIHNSDAARAFFVFLFSKEAAKILEDYGYIIPY